MDSIKIPTFWHANPALWFANIEAQFKLNKPNAITADETKYTYLVSTLPPDIAEEVSDVITSPPLQDKYNILKTAVIKRFTDSQQKKLQQLLNAEELGDRKPTQLLRKMKSLIGTSNAVGEDLLKQLWMQRLPNNIQVVLTSQRMDLDKLAELADQIMDVTSPSASVISNQSNSEVESLRKEIESLRRQLGNANSNRRRSKRRDESRTKSRSPSRRKYDPNGQWCWYHVMFRKEARNCREPCTFTLRDENKKLNRNKEGNDKASQ